MSTLDNPNLAPVETFYVAEFAFADPDTAVRLLGPDTKAWAEHLVEDYNRTEVENAEMEMRPVRRRFEVVSATTAFARTLP